MNKGVKIMIGKPTGTTNPSYGSSLTQDMGHSFGLVLTSLLAFDIYLLLFSAFSMLAILEGK